MKLAEGVTSKLWLWGKIFVGKMDKHIRAEDLRKRRNTIGVLGPHGRIYATFAK